MRGPRSARSIVALVFLALGASFTLLGVLGLFAVPIPMRNGELWMFLPAGLPLLLAGLVLALSLWRTNRLQKRLQTQGTAVTGQVVKIQYHPYTSYGSDGIYKRHPWTVLCSYRWETSTYFVRSQFLWQQPREDGQHPTVYLDPLNPKQAWLDPETLTYEI